MKSIVTISGTSRPDNFTSRALGVVNDELKRKGIEPVVFDARELTLAFPGQPETDDAKRLQEAVGNASGVILATPEYHGSFCAMTKLIIENLGFPSKLKGKAVALMGVAAGRIGAIKSLEQLRGICGHVGAVVVPGAMSVAGVRAVFDDDGNCTDPATEAALQKFAGSVLEFIQDYVCPKHELEAMVRGDARPWTARL